MDHVNYQPLFMVVSAIMFIAIGVLFLTVKEPKLTAENQALEKQHPEWNLAPRTTAAAMRSLPKPVKQSLGFLLASIALWFIGYNGVTTWFSTYVRRGHGPGSRRRVDLPADRHGGRHRLLHPHRPDRLEDRPADAPSRAASCC